MFQKFVFPTCTPLAEVDEGDLLVLGLILQANVLLSTVYGVLEFLHFCAFCW